MTDYSLLPVVSSGLLEKGLDFAFAKLLDRIEPPFPELMDPRATPAEFLPYLAADRGVNEWSATAPDSEKRLTVELAWPTKRQAGTRAALENAIRGLELVPDVTAWYEQTPMGSPYSFKVRAFADKPYSQDMDLRLDRRIAEAKSERDTLAVSVGLDAFGTHSIAAAAFCGELTTIYPLELTGIQASGSVFMGLGYYAVEITTIFPQGL